MRGRRTARKAGQSRHPVRHQCPLVEHGRVWRFLLVNDGVVRTWTEDELAFVREVADRTWAAAERARAVSALVEETRALETLNRIGSALAGELDLDRIVQMVTDAGVELTEAQFGAFFYNVVNEAGESYTLYSLSGVPREEFSKFPMPRNTHVFGPTFRGEGDRPLRRHHEGPTLRQAGARITACRKGTFRCGATLRSR